MTLETMQSLCAAEPFRPFVLKLANGDELRVASREFIARSPNGRMLAVYDECNYFHHVDLLRVVAATEDPKDPERTG